MKVNDYGGIHMSKLTENIILAAELAFAIIITACACGKTAPAPEITTAPPVTAPVAEPAEPSVNADLLDEFGMTLGELEAKHGSVTGGEYNPDNKSFTYYFGDSDIGYTFLYNAEQSGETLSDGTPLVTPNSVYNYFKGKVGDVFLGFGNKMNSEEFNKMFGGFDVFDERHEGCLAVPPPADWELPDWSSGFYHWNDYANFVVYINHDNDVITPDSLIEFIYQDEINPYKTDLAPLDLLGCLVTNDGMILIKYPDTNPSYEPDAFRKYFFGTWQGGETMIIDDSELCNNGIMLRSTVNWVNDHVIAVSFTNGGLGDVYWIDADNTDTMYHIYGIGGYVDYPGYGLAGNIDQKPYCDVFTKTDAPVNEPQNGFISNLVLDEMSHEYGVDVTVFTYISDVLDGVTLYRDDYYFASAIYLVTAEPDKIVYTTTVYAEFSDTGTVANKEIDATVTLVKTDGIWKRTVDFNQEQIANLRKAVLLQ